MQLAAFVDRAIPAVMAPLLKSQFQLSDTQLGAIHGPAFATLYALGLLVAAHTIAGRDPYRVAAVCVAVWTLGSGVFALAPDYPTMIGGRILLGLGQAGFPVAALMLLGRQRDSARRARSLSVFTTGSSVGRSIALFLGGAALAAIAGRSFVGLEPWRAATLLLILPNFLLTAFLWRSGSLGPAAGAPEPTQGLGAACRLIMDRRAILMPMMLAGCGCVLAIHAGASWIPSYLNRGFDLGASDAALVAGAVVLICAPVGHLGAGWIDSSVAGRRIGAGGLIIAGMGLAAISAAVIATAQTLPMAVLGTAGLTVGGGFAAATCLIALQALSAEPLRPQVGSIYLALVSLAGVGLGPLVTGVLSDHLFTGAAGLSSAMAATVILSAAAVSVVAGCFARHWTRHRQAMGEA